MHERAARALAALCIPVALSVAILTGSDVCADAAAAAIQKFDPGQCQEDDKGCVTNWFKEYSAQILAEVRYYARQEDFLAQMLAEPQEPLITARLSLLLIEGGVAYTQWVPLKDEAVAEAAALDMPRYRAAIGVCRDAVADMRQALFDLRQHREAVRAEAAQYLKNVTACERAFSLAAPISKLRGTRQPVRAPALGAAAPDAIAPDAPMDIRTGPARP